LPQQIHNLSRPVQLRHFLGSFYTSLSHLIWYIICRALHADRGGSIEKIALTTLYTNERLQAAIECVARILGQDLTSQNPVLNTRLPDGSRVAVVGAPSSIAGPTFTVRKFNR